MASGDNPTEQLIIPSVSTAVRDVMIADVGTIIYDTTQSKLCVCVSKAAGAASWEIITSTSEGI